MSTRATISYITLDNEVHCIYCHHGHIDDIGATLAECYTDPDKVWSLVCHGAISRLYPEIGKRKHRDFFAKHTNTTVFYNRDGGEGLYISVYEPLPNGKPNLDKVLSEEYAYTFDAQTREWYVRGGIVGGEHYTIEDWQKYVFKDWRKLSDALKDL